MRAGAPGGAASWLAFGLAAALMAGACDRPEASPPPAAQPRPSLRPLTSRDGAEAPPFATPPSQALPPGHPPVEAGSAAASTAEAVSGTVEIAPALRARQSAQDALFIVARSSASGQVLAVRKEENVRFPLSFRISGVDAMVEGTAFVGPFDITARLSKSGDALPAPGDIEGTIRGVAAGARGVSVTLDRVRK